MKAIPISFALAMLMYSCLSQQSNHQQFAEKKTCPFSAIKWLEEQPLIKVDDQWYELIAMGDHRGEDLLHHCKLIYPNRWKRRFGEDFVEFLWQLNIKPGLLETFALKDENGKRFTMDLEFTADNRKKVYQYYRAHYDKDVAFDFRKILARKELEQDLEFLRETIHNSYAYAELKGLDVDVEIDRIIDALPVEMSMREFGILLQEFLGKFGDGHSRVKKLNYQSFGRLPFETAFWKEKILCFSEGKLLDQTHPYLYSINGIRTEEFLEMSRRYLVADGSEQLIRYETGRAFRNIGFLLSRFNAYGKKLKIVLMNEGGAKISQQHSLLFEEPISKSEERKKLLARALESISYQELEGGIAYLNIANMFPLNPEEEFAEIMQKADGSKAMIIDVRNNRGGSRMTINALLPYFFKEEESPVIASLGRLRTDLQQLPTEGVLADRFMFPLSASAFNEKEREIIQLFQKQFRPEWQFDSVKYSDWHYYLLRSSPDKKMYEQPVVILMNEACFSATDIFLSAFDQLDHVVLMGMPSGGGSGRVIEYTLPRSGYELALSSMISFQANGKLYDGVGIQPDIIVPHKEISDVLGESDSQLAHAIQYLLTSKKK